MADREYLIRRLELAIARLEILCPTKDAKKLPLTPLSPYSSAHMSSVYAFDSLIDSLIQGKFIETSERISGKVGACADALLAAMRKQKTIIVAMAQCSKPGDEELQSLLAPMGTLVGNVQKMAAAEPKSSKDWPYLKAMAEIVESLKWVLCTGKDHGMNLPGPHVHQSWYAAKYFCNKILAADLGSSQEASSEWVKRLKEIFVPGLKDYVEKFHSSGPSWNINGKPFSKIRNGLKLEPDRTDQPEQEVNDLYTRIEAAIFRLEGADAAVLQLATVKQEVFQKASSMKKKPKTSVSAFDDLLTGPLRRFQEASGKVGGKVEEGSKIVVRAFQEERKIIYAISVCQRPSAEETGAAFGGLKALIGQLSDLTKGRKTEEFNQLKAMAESARALTWVQFPGTLSDILVGDCWTAAQFYQNKVLMAHKGQNPSQVEWASCLKALFVPGLTDYVIQFHPSGPSWSRDGVPFSEFTPPLVGEEEGSRKEAGSDGQPSPAVETPSFSPIEFPVLNSTQEGLSSLPSLLEPSRKLLPFFEPIQLPPKPMEAPQKLPITVQTAQMPQETSQKLPGTSESRRAALTVTSTLQEEASKNLPLFVELTQAPLPHGGMGASEKLPVPIVDIRQSCTVADPSEKLPYPANGPNTGLTPEEPSENFLSQATPNQVSLASGEASEMEPAESVPLTVNSSQQGSLTVKEPSEKLPRPGEQTVAVSEPSKDLPAQVDTVQPISIAEEPSEKLRPSVVQPKKPSSTVECSGSPLGDPCDSLPPSEVSAGVEPSEKLPLEVEPVLAASSRLEPSGNTDLDIALPDKESSPNFLLTKQLSNYHPLEPSGNPLSSAEEPSRHLPAYPVPCMEVSTSLEASQNLSNVTKPSTFMMGNEEAVPSVNSQFNPVQKMALALNAFAINNPDSWQANIWLSLTACVPAPLTCMTGLPVSHAPHSLEMEDEF